MDYWGRGGAKGKFVPPPKLLGGGGVLAPPPPLPTPMSISFHGVTLYSRSGQRDWGGSGGLKE